MSNIILACGSFSDKGTLTGSATAAGLGLENLKKQAIAQPARFTSGAGFIIVDLGAVQDLDFVALMGMNAASGDCRVRAAVDLSDITALPDYDSGTVDLVVGQTMRKNAFYHRTPAPVSARYWRIDFSADDVTYLDIGRLYVGLAFCPDVNMDYGESQGFIDPSEKRYTKSGRMESNRKPKRRTAQFALSFGTKEEMYGHAFDMDSDLGTTGDILFIADLDDPIHLQKRSIYGTMTELSPVVNSYFKLYEKTYRIEEITA